MHYLIDGYNLLFKAFDSSSELLSNRQKVLSYLKHALQAFKLDITVIFDGKEQDLSYESFDFIKVVYTSKNLSADDFILEIISNSSHPSNYTVITSDKSLIKQCCYYGAKIMNIKDFLKWLEGKSLKKVSRKTPSFQDSKENIERLLKIFEKRFRDNR